MESILYNLLRWSTPWISLSRKQIKKFVCHQDLIKRNSQVIDIFVKPSYRRATLFGLFEFLEQSELFDKKIKKLSLYIRIKVSILIPICTAFRICSIVSEQFLPTSFYLLFFFYLVRHYVLFISFLITNLSAGSKIFWCFCLNGNFPNVIVIICLFFE